MLLSDYSGPSPPTRGFKLFPEGAAELGFLLLGCTSRLTSGVSFLGTSTSRTPFPPAVSLECLWGSGVENRA